MKQQDWRRARNAPADALGLTRRGVAGPLMSAFATFALLGEAEARAPRISAARWIARQSEIARALSSGQMTPLAWMGEVENLARDVDLAELIATVNRSRIAAAPAGAANDPPKRFVRFLDETGEPRRLGYGAALFNFAPHNVITPHGHRHMVSAHLVIEGQLRVRNFDRVRDEGEAMVIRPTRDYIARAGAVSTMSSERDNIHWFTPQGGSAATFDVIISDLDANAPSYEIRAIDVLAHAPRADGSILAPIMGFAESSRRYTADV